MHVGPLLGIVNTVSGVPERWSQARVYPDMWVDPGLAPALGHAAHRVHDADQWPDMQASIQPGRPTLAGAGDSLPLEGQPLVSLLVAGCPAATGT